MTSDGVHEAVAHLDAHTLLDSDTLELVSDGFALLLGLGDLFVCSVGFCSPFQLVSFLACSKKSAGLAPEAGKPTSALAAKWRRQQKTHARGYDYDCFSVSIAYFSWTCSP